MSSTPSSVYPLASENGGFIPLAVAKPRQAYRRSLAANAYSTIQLPVFRATNELEIHCMTIMATKSTVVRFMDTAIDPAEAIPLADDLPGCMILLPNVAHDLSGSGYLYICSLEASNIVVVNIYERWTQLRNQQKYGVS